MTNPEVQHGKQPPVNPEVVTSGPLGENPVRQGTEQVPVSPDPAEAPEPAEPAEPEVTESEPEAEPDAEPDADEAV